MKNMYKAAPEKTEGEKASPEKADGEATPEKKAKE